MNLIARIALGAGLLMGGATLAMAQNGPATGGYPPARWNPNLFNYYNYYAGPRYAPSYNGGSSYYRGYRYYYPGYGYTGPRGWR